MSPHLSSPSPWSDGVPIFSLLEGAADVGSWILAIFCALSDSGDATAGELEFVAVATFADAVELAVVVLEVTGEEFAAVDFDGLQKRKAHVLSYELSNTILLLSTILLMFYSCKLTETRKCSNFS